MKIKYFAETDTALMEFSDHVVAETREINENLYLDLDEEGNVVSMTIEHASLQADMEEVAYQRVAGGGGAR